MWIILACFAFAPVLAAGFLDWDDREMVVHNPMLTAGHFADVVKSWTQPTLDLYAPLTYTAYAALAFIGRATTGAMQPAFFHAANLACHLGSAVMVLLLLRRLSGDDHAALIGALIWAVHPIQVEAVAWVASLNTCLCTMLAIAALLLQTMALTTPGLRRRNVLFLLAAVAMVLSLCAKPGSVGLPLAALGINRFVLKKSWRTAIGISVIGIVLAIPFILVGTMAQPGVGGFILSPSERLAVIGHTITFYLYKITVPFGYSIDYGLSPDVVLSSEWLRWIGLVLLSILALMLWQCRRRPWLIGATCIFLGGVGPVCGIRNFEFQNISTVADRYTYLAMVGIALVTAMAVRGKLQNNRNLAIASTIIGLLAGETFLTTLKWHDSLSLTTATVAANPQSLAAVILEGDRAADQGNLAAEERVFRYFLSRRPMFVPINKALAYLLLGTNRATESIEYFHRALQVLPDPQVYNDLGAALVKTNQLPAAVKAIDAAIALQPTDAVLYANKGEILHRMGDDAAAIAAFRAALQIDPHEPNAMAGLQLSVTQPTK